MKMGYFTTIVNNYQQLINFFSYLNMILARKNNQPQTDLGNSPRGLGTSFEGTAGGALHSKNHQKNFSGKRDKRTLLAIIHSTGERPVPPVLFFPGSFPLFVFHFFIFS